MKAEQMKALREPFPPEQIGLLPKAGISLQYVGHADITDRLLTVDPDWTWEPMGRTPEGLPALDQFGNLWIYLTLCGVTRPGVGDGKSMKECVGDALRNAAMRFGVALDLWAKGDRSFGLAGHDAPAKEQIGYPAVTIALQKKVMEASRPFFTSKPDFEADFQAETGEPFQGASDGALSRYLSHLNTRTVTP